MADPEHVDLVARGVEVWNAWREAHPQIQPDLAEADLSGVALKRANLRFTDLGRARLCRADLRGANLYRACADDVDMTGARLTSAILYCASLRRACLEGANLRSANLLRADFSGADLARASLVNANVKRTILDGASLRDADLSHASLVHTSLQGTRVEGARCHRTIFADLDLGSVEGLEHLVHEGPSTLGLDTVERSPGLPRVFLIGVGASEAESESDFRSPSSDL